MGSSFSYTLERSARRSVGIQIKPPNIVIVKAPYLLPKFFIDQFVEQKTSWIQKQLAVVRQYPVKQRLTLSEGDVMYHLGKPYHVHITDASHISVTTTFNFPRHLLFRWQTEITNWYIKEAKRIITDRLAFFCNRMHTSYTRLSFSDTSSKWGSCAPDNSLQFNWRLVMAPLMVLDYVVVHELAHTKEKNHGAKFWAIVVDQKPAYKQHVKWLKRNSHTLHGI